MQWDDTVGLGLHYMHARHYSSELGRFLQPDPAASEQHYDGYALRNPLTLSDSSGSCTTCSRLKEGYRRVANSCVQTGQFATCLRIAAAVVVDPNGMSDWQVLVLAGSGAFGPFDEP